MPLPDAPPRASAAVARFMLGSLAAIAVVVVGGFFALRSVTIREAERDTRGRVELQGAVVESAGLSDGILRRDPAAIAKLDDVVAARLLSPSVVRVKLWSRDGRILYSDEPAIIGRRFGLGAEERELFTEGGADAELSDLSAAREPSTSARRAGCWRRTRSSARRTGRRCCSRPTSASTRSARAASGCCARSRRRCSARLLVLLLFQVPLAWSLARRLQRGHRERERLLARTIEASDHERRRIAADLHDGVVQDLAGVAFGLAPLAEDARRRGDEAEATALRESTARLRQGVRALRTLLVEIHPPRLETAGLEPVLDDLLSPLAASGHRRPSCEVDDARGVGLAGRCAGLPRGARGAAQRRRARRGDDGPRRGRRVATAPSRSTVTDDGRGFDGDAPRRARRRGPCRPDVVGGPGRRGRRHAGRALGAGRGDDRRAGGAGRMIRVLLADDHGVIRDGLGRLISSFDDIELVGTAADGVEAVALAAELEPDVVVMDLEMPRLDGIEATRQVLADHPGTAVLVLTSFSDRPRILGAIEAGACGYLLKDVAADEVAEGIRAAARGESPIDPRAARTILTAQAQPDPAELLSAREGEVLALLVEGLPNKLIARRLEISEKTVKTHLTSIFRALGVTDRTQAALWAERSGFTARRGR